MCLTWNIGVMSTSVPGPGSGPPVPRAFVFLPFPVGSDSSAPERHLFLLWIYCFFWGSIVVSCSLFPPLASFSTPHPPHPPPMVSLFLSCLPVDLLLSFPLLLGPKCLSLWILVGIEVSISRLHRCINPHVPDCKLKDRRMLRLLNKEVPFTLLTLSSPVHHGAVTQSRRSVRDKNCPSKLCVWFLFQVIG